MVLAVALSYDLQHHDSQSPFVLTVSGVCGLVSAHGVLLLFPVLFCVCLHFQLLAFRPPGRYQCKARFNECTPLKQEWDSSPPDKQD